MRRASFGLMDTGRCVPAGSENPSCVADVMSVFDEQCSGKPACTVYATDQRHFESYTCPDKFIPYLEVYYDCITGIMINIYDQIHLLD